MLFLFLSGALAMAANPGAIVWGQNFLPDNPGMASGHDAWFIFWFRWYKVLCLLVVLLNG